MPSRLRPDTNTIEQRPHGCQHKAGTTSTSVLHRASCLGPSRLSLVIVRRTHRIANSATFQISGYATAPECSFVVDIQAIMSSAAGLRIRSRRPQSPRPPSWLRSVRASRPPRDYVGSRNARVTTCVKWRIHHVGILELRARCRELLTTTSFAQTSNTRSPARPDASSP